MAVGQAADDAPHVRLVHHDTLAEGATAFRALARQQMAAACTGALDLAAGGDFEPLRHGLLRSDAFRTTHN